MIDRYYLGISLTVGDLASIRIWQLNMSSTNFYIVLT